MAKIILIGSTALGSGDTQLGELIMANFLRILNDYPRKPINLIFWNTGVKLVAEGSDVLTHLKRLEEAGVEILVCTTCAEYLDVVDKISVGKLSTMSIIQDLLLKNEVLTV